MIEFEVIEKCGENRALGYNRNSEFTIISFKDRFSFVDFNFAWDRVTASANYQNNGWKGGGEEG